MIVYCIYIHNIEYIDGWIDGFSRAVWIFFYEVYAGYNFKRSGWAKHVKTQKHIDGILNSETNGT